MIRYLKRAAIAAIGLLVLTCAANAACPYTSNEFGGVDSSPTLRALNDICANTATTPTGGSTGAKQDAQTSDLDAIKTAVQGATPAGSNGIGNVGGFEFNTSTNPTVQNAAYSSGNCMGGFQTVSVARSSGGAGILNNFEIFSKGGSTVAMQIYVFQQNPSGSTCTDKSTFTIAAADIPNLIATFSLTPAAPIGTTITYAEARGLGASFTTSGNANIYVGIVAGGSVTPATTSDILFNVGGPRD